MEDEQGSSGIPPAARRFLERPRPAGDMLGSAGRNIEEHNDSDDDDNEAKDQPVAEHKLEVEAPEIDGGPSVAIDAPPEVLVPPAQHSALLLRAKGAKHPPVPTRAQIKRNSAQENRGYRRFSLCFLTSVIVGFLSMHADQHGWLMNVLPHWLLVF